MTPPAGAPQRQHRICRAVLVGLGVAGVLAAHAAPHRPASGQATGRAAGQAVTGIVTAISDGDTVRVATVSGEDLGRVRLLGIDAPELAHDGRPGQCWATQSRTALVELVPVGSSVELVPDPTQADRDSSGRLLRYLYRGGRDIQQVLVTQGHARAFWPHGPGTQAVAYRQAAAGAEHGHRGLWAACPSGGAPR